jgi:hypothetical protein
VSDERDIIGRERILRKERFDSRDDTGGNAFGRPMRRRHFYPRCDLARARVDCHDVGKRSPNVNA